MIVSSLGHGYISSFFLKEVASNGVKCIGVTDNPKNKKNNTLENITIVSRAMTIDTINKTTHLVVTAPPKKNNCPILIKFGNEIRNSNIRSVVYISSTGVYGDHKGNWVDEKSTEKGNKNIVNKNRIKAEKSWSTFCKNNEIILNIVRLGGIYGPGRTNLDSKALTGVLIKENHFFSRIHVLDISRLLVKILFNSNSNNCWNLVDERPSTRKDFVLRIIELKKVKKYSFKNYENLKNISKTKKRFWEANKKVSSKKVKDRFNYTFLYPSYLTGLKHIINSS